jgi:hypothetical protein
MTPTDATRRPAAFVAAWLFAVLIGSVVDRTTGQPLPGVTIALGNLHAISGTDGTFRLSGVKPGRATLNVSSDDVPPQTFSVTVGTTTSHVALRLCSTTLDYNCGPPR